MIQRKYKTYENIHRIFLKVEKILAGLEMFEMDM